jgi:hypothetical protein
MDIGLQNSDGTHNSALQGADGAAQVITVNSLISYHWTSADDTDAPTATGLSDYVIGLASDGATGGAVYHVIDEGWVATGTTVANLYGG